MKTIRMFKKIQGNQFEHYADKQGNTTYPIKDDTVYVKMNRDYQPTKLRILCSVCRQRRSQCHCAPEAPPVVQEKLVTTQQRPQVQEAPRFERYDTPDTLGEVLRVQRERGLRS